VRLKEYAKLIEDLAFRYPNAEVVYSSDEEGNSFEKVYHAPTLGLFDGFDFYSAAEEEVEVNAICIN
jgi:hypothetical protein